ncbi:MAG: hypothetical protein CVV44_00125 [Spirochaetae bacterium HGW-Spirochaetae-1]|jgi:hypothetical protein|nr:MAG: hypothetical protein CVV44_00125 [Spirochaetae bacterium HGW-Spirochaetae-1]
MNMKKACIIAVLCFVSACLITGCTIAQLAFPKGSDKTVFDQYDVKGRRAFAIFSGKYSFGPYTVDWTRGAVLSKPSGHKTMFGDEKSTISTETYTVAVSENGAASWKAECRSEAEFIKETKSSRKVTTTSTVIISNTLTCTMKSADKQTCEFKMKQDTGSMMISGKKTAAITWRNSSFEIQGSRRLEGAAWDVQNDAGYYITEAGKLVAVVDVVNDGKVYIAKELGREKTSLLVMISAALLSYKDIMQ